MEQPKPTQNGEAHTTAVEQIPKVVPFDPDLLALGDNSCDLEYEPAVGPVGTPHEETPRPSIKETLTLQAGIMTTALALGLYAANGGRAHRARHLKMQNGGLNQKQPMPKEQKRLRRRKRR